MDYSDVHLHIHGGASGARICSALDFTATQVVRRPTSSASLQLLQDLQQLRRQGRFQCQRLTIPSEEPGHARHVDL